MSEKLPLGNFIMIYILFFIKKSYTFISKKKTSMDCPVCLVPMFIMELDSVEVDHCFSCKGIWLDAGELEELLHSAAAKDELLASFTIVNSTETIRRCPICLSKMNKVEVGEKGTKVLIDSCKKDHGIWFDEGELHEVISNSSRGNENPVLHLLQKMFSYDLSNKKEK